MDAPWHHSRRAHKPVKKWKRILLIALKANVPILLIGLDYAKKEAKTLGMFYPRRLP